MAVIREPKHKQDLVMRLKRIEGQLRGIQAMIASDAECERITQQLSAARRALDKAFYNVLACALQSGVGAGPAGKAAVNDRVKQAAALLAKFG